MSDSKPLASLTSSLLARKGHAAPAMRRQALQSDDGNPISLDDLGWNDMGPETRNNQPVPFPGVTTASMPELPAVHKQQESLAEKFDVEPVHNTGGLTPMSATPMAPVRRAAPGSKAKSAFTLRLDGDRHLQLRLVCAMKHRSAQQIVTEALDAYLARQPEVADLERKSR